MKIEVTIDKDIITVRRDVDVRLYALWCAIPLTLGLTPVYNHQSAGFEIWTENGLSRFDYESRDDALGWSSAVMHNVSGIRQGEEFAISTTNSSSLGTQLSASIPTNGNPKSIWTETPWCSEISKATAVIDIVKGIVYRNGSGTSIISKPNATEGMSTFRSGKHTVFYPNWKTGAYLVGEAEYKGTIESNTDNDIQRSTLLKFGHQLELVRE